jgi:SAM-dependent methyltransferase
VKRKFRFDAGYYARHYPKGRGDAPPRRVLRLVDFVAAYLRHLELPVKRILDIGCGRGSWRARLEEHFPRARYHGVELSRYLCDKYGWQQGSVVDYRSRVPFDLVICQGVLQYLDDVAAERALANLAELCRGALYLEALTQGDWLCNVDRAHTDGETYRRNVLWYKRRLMPHFTHAGGGLWLQNRADWVLFELERG